MDDLSGGGGGMFQMFGAVGQYMNSQLAIQARQMGYAEQVRQLTMKRDYTVGLAQSRAGASGVDMTSASTTDYLKKLTGEFNTEIDRTRLLARTMEGIDQDNASLGLFMGIGKGVGSFMGANGA
jgi:hypothetical protein